MCTGGKAALISVVEALTGSGDCCLGKVSLQFEVVLR